MKLRTIFIVSSLFMVLYIALGIYIRSHPNDNRKLNEAQAVLSVSTRSVIDNHWAYYLINRDNPLPEDFTVALDTVQGQFTMDERCAAYGRDMIAAAKRDGIDLMVVSAYRSVRKQQENLESYTERLINNGYTREEALILAKKEIAEPYTSEHNAGLALDILTTDWWETHDDITDDFENTEEFRWLSENAYKFGFIMRYPKEYEDITGYSYEPWHYRFVGIYYAEKIKESGLPFEYFYKTNF